MEFRNNITMTLINKEYNISMMPVEFNNLSGESIEEILNIDYKLLDQLKDIDLKTLYDLKEIKDSPKMIKL